MKTLITTLKNLFNRFKQWLDRLSKDLKQDVRLSFEILGFVISFVGLTLAYLDSKQARTDLAYRELADSYAEVLKLVIDDYKIDCYDVPDTTHYDLTQAQRHKQRVIYTLLINHFEQAYLLIKDDKNLWPGWEYYIKRYFQRKAFVNTWCKIQFEWSKEFRAHVRDRIIPQLVKDNKLPKEYLDKVR